MKERVWGRAGVVVSEIGMGTWTMSKMWSQTDDSQAVKALIRAMELGVNFIDTAAVYGDGHSERLIAAALVQSGRRVQGRPFIATKVPPHNRQWPGSATARPSETFPAAHVVRYTEESLKNLGLDCIDLQQLHVWHDNWLADAPSSEAASGDASFLAAIDKLKSQGKIRFFGVSINDHAPETALKIVASGLIDSVQVIYNIFDQSPEKELFPLCQKHGVAVIARVPFDEGSLTGLLTPETRLPKKDWRQYYFTPERIPEVCARVEKIRRLTTGEGSPAQVALKFILAHPAVSTVIPGMRKVAHVEENLQASGNPLPATLLAGLKNHAWPRNFYPRWD
jgi:aryl-alcohol dehydrogenase-like predicted oxidoreductase